MVKVFEGENSITMLFGSQPNQKTLFIDIEEDRLYWNGNWLKTTKLEFNYNKDVMFEKNKKFEKKRILTHEFEGKVLAIDCGFDGRVFGKFFTKKKYLTFRGNPEIVFSYWHCRREGLKKWYSGDLSNPKKVWKVQYNNQVI